jgi:streptogramin lyase
VSAARGRLSLRYWGWMACCVCAVTFLFAAVGAGAAGASTYIEPLPLPSGVTMSSVARMTVGPDGDVWFTGKRGGPVGCFCDIGVLGHVTSSGAVTLRDLTTADGPDDGCGHVDSPDAIVAGADGALWVQIHMEKLLCNDPANGGFYDYVFRFTLGGELTETYEIPPSPKAPNSVGIPPIFTAGPDGNIWFVGEDEESIGRMTLSGGFSYFTQGITAGATGS